MYKNYRFLVLAVLLLAGLFLTACGGQLPPGAEATVDDTGTSATVEFVGVVDSIATDQWVIAGQVVLVNAQTVIDGSFTANDVVKVYATVDANGLVTATKIESPTSGNSTDDSTATSTSGNSADDSTATPTAGDSMYQAEREFTGKVESITADSWTVAGRIFIITSATEIKGSILVGDLVKVHYITNSDGTFTATEIEGTTRTQVGDEAEFVGVVEVINPDTWVVSGKTFAVNAQTEIKGQLKVGDKVKVHAFLDANGILTAREIELANTTVSTGVSEEDMKVYGTVELISADHWVIGGQTILVTSQTMIDGNLSVGDRVKAEVFVRADGSLVAKEIESDTENHSTDDSGSGGSGDDSGGSSDDSDSGSSSDDDGTDDKGSGTPEPGDDKGSGTPEPGDDKGGSKP